MAIQEKQPRRSVEDFHFGARVVSADGKHIGSLNFMIIDGESFDIHAIVVKETRHFSGHYVAATALMEDDISIPLGAVKDVTHDLITLSITSAEARRTQPYLTYQYTPPQKGDLGRLLMAQVGQTGYVPHLIEEAHKRLDELEISRGENVMLGRTGKKLGTVRDLVLDEGELAGVVIRSEGFFKDDVLLQVRFLGRSDDLALFAHLTQADIAHLQPFHPSGTVQAPGDEQAARPEPG
jgi:sporulation protein YlmC with PRC-barrel domain